MKRFNHTTKQSAFTIVELIVVIVVIGILASIVGVAYSGWQKNIITTQIKNNLVQAASAMESSRTFGGTTGYPLTVPSSLFTANDGVTVTGGGSVDGTTFCLDGASTKNTSLSFYLYSGTKDQGALVGKCATSVASAAPTAPSGITIVSTVGTQINVSWSAITGATSYTAQCASDPGFITGVQQATVSAPTVTAAIQDVSNTTTMYCRLQVTTSSGTSPWSPTATTNSTNQYGSLAVATSIEGYWTTAPQGFLLEDGSAVSRTTYSDLFAVIGTKYGAGDGSSTFNVPDSRGKTVVGRSVTGTAFANTNFNVLGSLTGQKSQQLNVGQLPAHSHGIFIGNTDDLNFTGSAAGNQVPPADAGSGPWDNGAKTTASGGTSSFTKLQPYVVRSFAIKYAPIDSTAPTLPAGTSIHGYWSTAPSGYLLENGAAVSRTTYNTLYGVTANTYGPGDGSTTFNLPNTQGLVTFTLNSSDSSFGLVGTMGGEDTHVLLISEIPAHTHGLPIGPIDDQNFTGYVTVGQYPPGDAGGVYDLGTNTGVTGSNQPFNQTQPVIVQNYAVKTTAATGTAKPVVTGTSVEGYWTTVPAGFLAEDGAAVSRTTYSELFSLIGVLYGPGDGSTTFNVPNSKGKLGVNLSKTESEFDAMGDTGGFKTHVLSNAEMPIHTHSILVGTIDDKNFTGYQGSAPQQYAPADSTVPPTMGSIYAKSVGGGQAFPVLQKYITKQVVIKI